LRVGSDSQDFNNSKPHILSSGKKSGDRNLDKNDKNQFSELSMGATANGNNEHNGLTVGSNTQDNAGLFEPSQQFASYQD